MIEKFINSIRLESIFSLNTFQDEEFYTFYGDGSGDFEKIYSESIDRCIFEYIQYCENQIKIAKRYLQLNKDN